MLYIILYHSQYGEPVSVGTVLATVLASFRTECISFWRVLTSNTNVLQKTIHFVLQNNSSVLPHNSTLSFGTERAFIGKVRAYFSIALINLPLVSPAVSRVTTCVLS